MLRSDQQVMTRDGRAARILSFTAAHTEGPYHYPILAEVEHPSEIGGWIRWHYMADGRWKSNDPKNPNDLVPVRAWSYDGGGTHLRSDGGRMSA